MVAVPVVELDWFTVTPPTVSVKVQVPESPNELMDRVAGLEEMRAARRHVAALTPRIAEAELAVTARRREFLAKRVERRQVESQIQKAELKEAVQAARRAQGELDGWFLSRARRRGGVNGGA